MRRVGRSPDAPVCVILVLTMSTAALDKLKDVLAEMERVVVAYSGGVDSTFLLRVATEVLGDNAVGVIGESESVPASELEAAQRLAAEFGAGVDVLRTNELADSRYAQNPENRCYYCKTELFSKLRAYADQRGIPWVVDGCNKDDEGDWRPGMQAARELGVRSPLREAGLTKAMIRELSRELGLPTWDKPAAACLASRIPYGTPITAAALAMVEKSEEVLKRLGFRQVRVRHHTEIARLELAADELAKALEEPVRREIVERLQEIGYRFVTVDLQGYRQGSFNPRPASDRAGTDARSARV